MTAGVVVGVGVVVVGVVGGVVVGGVGGVVVGGGVVVFVVVVRPTSEASLRFH